MTFKPLNENDTVNTRTLLHEAIPLTGSIISGSYVTNNAPDNIKYYSHGMFQTVYDYPYLSSSANHIFDITCGGSSQSGLTFGTNGQETKKNNIYGQMAQLLVGYDATGSVQLFDEDGNLFDAQPGAVDKMKEVFVIPFSRLLVKDEIKKETFQMSLDVSTHAGTQAFTDVITISDVSASTQYRVNSPAGEYGILYAADNNSLLDLVDHGNVDRKLTADGVDYLRCGLIFYQAGIAVVTGSIFGNLLTTPLGGAANEVYYDDGTTLGIDDVIADSSIDDCGTSFLHRVQNIQFNNTTELNSTVYFCRVNHNEFNYSSNPTYLENSRVRVKTQSTDEPVSYITTVGLYNDRNELLATAKLSEALKKTPSTEFTIRARLDY